MNALGRKIYLEMPAPSEEDNLPAEERIFRSLRETVPDLRGQDLHMSIGALRSLNPLCENADWKITVSLSWNGSGWEVVGAERGKSKIPAVGLAVDLGSTSVIMRMLDLETGECMSEAGVYNHQIRFGEDILTRIFYSRDQPEHLEEIRRATVDTFLELMRMLQRKTGIDPQNALSVVVAGNTAMTHFLLGLDAFSVFASPYAVETLQPGFYRGTDLELPVRGWVYCYPGLANYLGGDIVSGLVAVGLYRSEKISLFFDVGTNGELVVGNSQFLLCGAGAAGPALEGGVVKTGMRAAEGAVEAVRMTPDQEKKTEENGILPGSVFHLKTIGGSSPVGICGSGIVDMISELFLHGWINIQGTLQPEKSGLIQRQKVQETGEEELAVCYYPGLWFYQSDILEFIRTKAAAATMMEYMLDVSGIEIQDVARFYMAGSFGAHVDVESAVNIGMYPDVERGRIVPAGNTSLEGAQKLLLDRSLLQDIRQILGLMSYVQFGAVDDFLTRMRAAEALPHTDAERYPSVMEKLKALSTQKERTT